MIVIPAKIKCDGRECKNVLDIEIVFKEGLDGVHEFVCNYPEGWRGVREYGYGFAAVTADKSHYCCVHDPYK